MIIDIVPSKELYEKGNVWARLNFLPIYGLKLSDYEVYTYPPQKEVYIDDRHPKLEEVLMLIKRQGFNYSIHGQ